ncbi:hypothetical protein [Halomicrococcus sp. SG-WS-1]|uniref:hypothetical protein n=1 Tax=Halomicrococcus sp. SG-WS-1 TaxID=3439057 RepID=UPI003F79E630
MSDSSNMTSNRSSEQEEVVVFDESDPIAAIESLPPTVLPVSMKLELGKTTAGDKVHETLSTPEYPVDVRVPKGRYIPASTIHFDNPAERPPRNTKAWRPERFCEKLSELLEELEDFSHIDTSRIYLNGISVVELPPRYTTTDRETGQTVSTPRLYKDEGEMTLAYFRREGGLTATRVRDDLDTAMPGQSLSPPQLVQIKEVSAKPARSSRDTQQPAGRHKYYTEEEAARTNKSDSIPAVWKLRRVASPGESIRPLTPVLDEIDEFVPALSESELFQPTEFKGQTKQREQFYAEEVLSR